MDDLDFKHVFQLGPSAEDFNEANQAHAVNYGALLIALIDKGVITEAEYSRACARATHIMEQEFAKKRDDAKHHKDTP